MIKRLKGLNIILVLIMTVNFTLTSIPSKVWAKKLNDSKVNSLNDEMKLENENTKDQVTDEEVIINADWITEADEERIEDEGIQEESIVNENLFINNTGENKVEIINSKIITLEKGKNYEIVNNSSDEISVNIISKGKEFTAIRYYYFGGSDIYIWSKDLISQGFGLYSSDKLRISVIGEESIECEVSDVDGVEIREVEKPAVYYFNIEPNKNYEIINNSSHPIVIRNHLYGDSSYDWVKYRPNGEVYDSKIDNTESMYISSNYKMRLNGNGSENILCFLDYEDYEQIEIKEIDEKPLKRFTFEKDKNYEITNLGTERVIIPNTSEEDKTVYDYVSYDDYSSIYWREDNSGSMYIDKKLIITVLGEEDLEIWMPTEVYNNIKINEQEESALLKVTLEKDKNYEITYKGNKSFTISRKTGHSFFDYVTYHNNGSYTAKRKEYSSYFYMYADSTIRINTIDGYDTQWSMPASEVEFKEVEDPALYIVNSTYNNTYEIINNGDKEVKINNSISWTDRADFIHYYASGGVKKSCRGDRHNSDDVLLETGERVVFTASSETPIEWWMPYSKYKDNTLEVKKIDEPVYYDFTLIKGKNYEFINSNNNSVELETNDNTTNYDVISYEADGQLDEYSTFVNKIGGLYINELGNTRITVTTSDINFWIPYKQKTFLEIKEVDNPAFYKVIIDKNSHYEIVNNADEEIIIRNSLERYGEDNYYDYIKYDSDRNILGCEEAANYREIILDKDEILKTSIETDEEIIWWVPYENKSMVSFNKVNTPTLRKITIDKGKNYEIINKSNDYIKFITNTSSYNRNRIDAVKYYEDGQVNCIYKNHYDTYYYYITAPSGGRLVITTADENSVIVSFPYDACEVRECDNPPLMKFTVNPEETYEIKILGEVDTPIYNDARSYSDYYYYDFDLVEYDKNDRIVKLNNYKYDSKLLSKLGDFENGTKLVTTSSIEGAIEWWTPYELVEVKKLDHPAVVKVYPEEGKSYEILNKLTYDVPINITVCDYALYDSENNIKRYNYYSYVGSVLGENEKVQVESFRYDDKEIKVPYGAAEITELSEPIFFKYNLKPGKNYKIINKSSLDINILNTSSYWGERYKCISYNSDGSYEYKKNEAGDIHIKGNESFLISPLEENSEDITIYIPYSFAKDNIIVNELEYDILESFELLSKIKLDITKVVSVEKGLEQKIITDTLSNYNISIFNETKNQWVRGYDISTSFLLLPDKLLDEGDNLKITLNNKNNDCEEVVSTVVLDKNKSGYGKIQVNQLGKLNINYLKDPEVNSIIRTMIFDEAGEVVDTISTYKNNVMPLISLKEGKYKVILLRSDGYLWGVNNINQIEERGFEKGIDYLQYDVNIEKGVIEKINAPLIPILDEEKISFIDRGNIKFTVNSEQVLQGGSLEVRLEYNFKDRFNDKVNDVKISLKLPDNVDFVQNSVIVNNKKANYTTDSNAKEILIPMEDISGVIKLYVKPNESGNTKIVSDIDFVYDTDRICETLAITTFDVSSLTIQGINETNEKNIIVSGIAPINAKINIYDGKTLITETSASNNGRWSKEIQLNNPYNGSLHNIFAKINDGEDTEKISNTLSVSYYQEAPSIISAQMIHANSKIDLTKAILEGKREVITLVPNNPFSFVIEFKNGEQIESLDIISTRNGDRKKMNASYDKEKNQWIASGYFDSNNKSYTPGVINISYKVKNKELDIYKEIDFTSEEYVQALPEAWKDAKVSILDEDEDKINAEIQLNDIYKTKLGIEYKTEKIKPGDIARELTDSNKIEVKPGVFVTLKKVGGEVALKVIDISQSTTTTIITTVINIPGADVLQGFTGAHSDVANALNRQDKIDQINNYIDNLPESESKQNIQNQMKVLEQLNTMYSIVKFASTVIAMTGSITIPGLGAIGTIGLNIAVSLLWNHLDDVAEGLLDELLEKLGPNFEFSPNWLIDPSGYVYEAVDSNRLEGVRTTVYYKDEESGEAILWNAEDYDQVNPLYTDKQGRYAWDVPEGLWQVKYELEGYETTYSEWLPVPPPQTTVNIGMISKSKPEVTLFNVYEDKIELSFNKFIDVKTINSENVLLIDSNNNRLNIDIEPIFEDNINTSLADKFIIKSSNNFNTNSEYTLNINTSIKTYAGISADKDIILKSIYKKIPTNIKVENSYKCNYGDELTIKVSTDIIENIEEFKLNISSESEDIVKVLTPTINFDRNGIANVKILGELPGDTNLVISVEGTQIKKVISINVGLLKIGKKPQLLGIEDKKIEIGQSIDLRDGISALDDEDGDITKYIKISGKVDNTKVGTYTIVYEITDSHNNKVEKSCIISVEYRKEDINKDGIIDISDIALIGLNYGKTIEDSDWKSEFDFNYDNIIDIYDLIYISKNL